MAPVRSSKLFVREVARTKPASQLSEDLLDLHRQMSFAMWERNRLVHAVEVLKLSDRLTEAPELTLFHPKTGAEIHADSASLGDLAKNLRKIAGTALRLTHAVRQWRAAQDATSH